MGNTKSGVLKDAHLAAMEWKIELRFKDTDKSFIVVSPDFFKGMGPGIIRSLYRKYKIEYFVGGGDLIISKKSKKKI